MSTLDSSNTYKSRGEIGSEKFQIGWIVPVSCSVGFGIAAVILFAIRTADPLSLFLSFGIPAVLACVALAAIPLIRNYQTYYVAQSVVVVCFLTTMATTEQILGVQVILLVVVIADFVLLEPYPLNFFESIGLVCLGAGVQVAAADHGEALLSMVIGYHLPFVLLGLSMAIFGSLMTKHRERIVNLAESRDQLKEQLVELARVSSAYQDYAVDASEIATESERLRITRDIHDIVGYTLTNNLMLMESARFLIKENALALPAVIETARSSAEEGLEQIRDAMYRLRQQKNTYPTGITAISRLLKVFQTATSVKIRCDYTNMPSTISEEIDSAIYHLVQEALVNSFRHGKASEVSVQFWYDEKTVQVHVRDVGIGGGKVEEGIGLHGMRERIEHLGGILHAGTVYDGFLISASIPLKAALAKVEYDEKRNTHTDR
jgi:signal transduction histidine kinase